MTKVLALFSTLALFACKAEAADITLYYLPTCPHCHHAMDFFAKELPNATIDKIDVTQGDNAVKFGTQLDKCQITSRGVPLIVINGKCIQGFGPETGDEIKQLLKK